MKNINSYSLSRNWFNFCFENPEKIKPNHTAVYFFAIEHCNRLGWKKKFGFPTTMVMEAIGIKSYNTYIKTLNDLVDFGFIKMIEKSKNQYSSNIIALSFFNKALDKALDKALIKHTTKQSESIDSINKQVNNKTNKQETNKMFFLFWDKYHLISEKSKTDKEATLKYWNKLSKEEKQKAIDKIKPYCNSVSEKKYIKKARTYLADKNFNDEFENVEIKRKYKTNTGCIIELTDKEYEQYDKNFAKPLI